MLARVRGFLAGSLGKWIAALAATCAIGSGVILAAQDGGVNVDVGSSRIPGPEFPDETTTGVPEGTTLTAYTGPSNITSNGTTIDSKLITGCIQINAANVSITKSKIEGCDGEAVKVELTRNSTINLLIEDVEIDCGNEVGRTAVTPWGYTMRRVNFHGCDNATWAEDDVLIEDSYCHDEINYDPVLDPHTDCVQVPTGADNITLDRNTLFGNYRWDDDVAPNGYGNAAVTIAGDGSATNITVNNNLLRGGGYTLYCPLTGAPITVTDNHFSQALDDEVGGSGPSSQCTDEIDSGNIYHESGMPVPLG